MPKTAFKYPIIQGSHFSGNSGKPGKTWESQGIWSRNLENWKKVKNTGKVREKSEKYWKSQGKIWIILEKSGNFLKLSLKKWKLKSPSNYHYSCLYSHIIPKIPCGAFHVQSSIFLSSRTLVGVFRINCQRKVQSQVFLQKYIMMIKLVCSIVTSSCQVDIQIISMRNLPPKTLLCSN